MGKQRMTRVDHILELASNETIPETFGLVAAYCHCLTPQQACALLLQSLQSQSLLRDPVLRKVCNDIDHSYSRFHEKALQSLLRKFSQTDSRGRQSIGYCLTSLSQHVPATGRRNIQSIFLRSKYVGVRKRAYKSLSVETDVPQKLVENAWQQFRDPECAWLIVKTFPVDYLVQNRESLAVVLSEGWQLARLYLRIGEMNQHLLQELKAVDEISYCYVIAKLGLRLPAHEAKKFVDNSFTDERFGLLVWSLGRLGLWEALRYVQAQLPAIQEQKLASLRQKYGI